MFTFVSGGTASGSVAMATQLSGPGPFDIGYRGDLIDSAGVRTPLYNYSGGESRFPWYAVSASASRPISTVDDYLIWRDAFNGRWLVRAVSDAAEREIKPFAR